MRNTIEAMLWELWRTSRFEAIVRLAVITGGVVLLYILQVTRDFDPGQSQVLSGVLLMLIAITSVVTPSTALQLDNQTAGFGFRLGFMRPVSTLQLVGLPLAYAALFATVSFLIPVLLANQLFSFSISIPGPLCFVICLALCFMAATWSPATIAGKFTAIGLLATFAMAFVGTLHALRGTTEPILMAIGDPDYFQFGYGTYVFLFALAGSACMTTVSMVERQRHGDRLIDIRLHSLPVRESTKALQPSAFRSRFAAQCSFEFRRAWKQQLLTAIFFTCLVFIATVAIQFFDPDSNKGSVLWIGALLSGPPAFQLLGTDAALGIRRKHGAIQYPAFDATRPLTNEEMITAKLLVTTGCSVMGGLIILVAAACSLMIEGEWDLWTKLTSALGAFTANLAPPWFAVGIAALLLIYISSSSIVFAFGLWLPQRAPLLAVIAAIFYGSMVLAGWDMHRGWKLYYLWIAYGYLLALGVLGLSAYILWRAYQSGALGRPLFLIALGLWSVYVPSTLIMLAKFLPEGVSIAILAPALSLLVVPLASTAAAPLALASHRHQ